MVGGDTSLPSPALSDDDIIVGLEEIPRVVAIVPGTAADEAVADTIMHLAGETIGIAAVVGVIVAVVVRVAVDDVVVGDDMRAGGSGIDGFLQIEPRLPDNSLIIYFMIRWLF